VKLFRSEQDRQVHDGAGDEERDGRGVRNSDEVHTDRVPTDDAVETLARELCDTYYLTVDPNNIMADAFGKITEKTRSHWRAQAALLIERGWIKHDDFNARANRDQARVRTGHKSRW
jgi:hypothetical protein